jgi:hypothetical protein
MAFVLVYSRGMDIESCWRCNMHCRGHQPNYKCPCCEKLWGSKLKLHRHFLATICLGVKAIDDFKSWFIVVNAL